MPSSSRATLGVAPADLVEHLARRTHDLLNALHHVHGYSDCARLVAVERVIALPDPPGRIGRNCTRRYSTLSTASSADIAFLISPGTAGRGC